MYPEIRASAEAIAHETLAALRALLLSRRFQRAFAAAPPPVKVDIEAGSVHLDGWINTDVSNALSAGRGIRLATRAHGGGHRTDRGSSQARHSGRLSRPACQFIGVNAPARSL
jgi:hypothetical protein